MKMGGDTGYCLIATLILLRPIVHGVGVLFFFLNAVVMAMFTDASVCAIRNER